MGRISFCHMFTALVYWAKKLNIVPYNRGN